MIGLALFDEQVSMIDKDLIRNKILNSDLPDLDISSAISSISVDRIPTLRLDEFASKASLKLFKALEIDTDFLQMPANNLHHYYRFAELIPIVGLLEQLNVTNDSIHYDVGIVKFVRDIPRIRHYETLQPLIKSIEKNQSKFPNERQMVRQLDLLE